MAGFRFKSQFSAGTAVRCHHLGPVLCYSVGRDRLKKLDITSLGLACGDSIVFCFGEIDCRCHVHKYVATGRSYKNVIDGIIEQYFEAIILNKETIEQSGVDGVTFSV
jgi:hypothetical protein